MKDYKVITVQESIIGCLLISSEKFFEYENRIKNYLFEDPYSDIIKNIKEQYSTSDTIDLSIINFDYVKLSGFISTSKISNFEKHLVILENKFKNTILLELQVNVQENILSNIAPEITRSQVARHLERLDEEQVAQTETPEGIKLRVLEKIERAMSSGELTGVDTGFKTLNDITGGWQAPDFIVIAARPGMGKSQYIFNMIRNHAIRGYKPAIFSLEMDNDQIQQRLIGIETNIPIEFMRTGNLDPEEFKKIMEASQDLSKLKIFMNDDPNMDLYSLCNEARRLVRREGCQVIYIDYLQLIDIFGERLSTYDKITKISRHLKKLAKEIKVPVIALSQLSRSVEQRGGAKIPMLSDLRESGAIEQDADIVQFVYRPDYYGLEGLDSDEADKTHIITAKHRSGRLGTMYLQYNDGQLIEPDRNFITPDGFSVDIFDDTPLPTTARPDFTDDGKLPF